MIKIWKLKVKVKNETKPRITIGFDDEIHEMIIWKPWIRFVPEYSYFHYNKLKNNVGLMESLLSIGTYSKLQKNLDGSWLYSANIVGISPYMVAFITRYDRKGVKHKLAEIEAQGYINCTTPTLGKTSEMNILLNEYDKDGHKVFHIDKDYLNENITYTKAIVIGKFELGDTVPDIISGIDVSGFSKVSIEDESEIEDLSGIKSLPNGSKTEDLIGTNTREKDETDTELPLAAGDVLEVGKKYQPMLSHVDETDAFNESDTVPRVTDVFSSGEIKPEDLEESIISIDSISINQSELDKDINQSNNIDAVKNVNDKSIVHFHHKLHDVNGAGHPAATAANKPTTATANGYEQNGNGKGGVDIGSLSTWAKMVAIFYETEAKMTLTESDVPYLNEMLKMSTPNQIISAIQSAKVWRATLPANFNSLSEIEKKQHLIKSKPGYFLRTTGLKHIYNFIKNSPRYRKDMRKMKNAGVVSGLNEERVRAQQKKIIDEIRKNRKLKEAGETDGK